MKIEERHKIRIRSMGVPHISGDTMRLLEVLWEMKKSLNEVS
jgi:hypothetical protein